VVRTVGRYFPAGPGDGEPLARLEPQDVTPERHATVTVEVGRGQGWLACFVAPGPAPGPASGPAAGTPAADGAAILLFHPDPGEMRLR
jgi:hypothetical protein